MRNRTAVTIGLIALGLVLVFHFVYRNPSPELISFVSRVTGNALGEVKPAPGGVEAPPTPTSGPTALDGDATTAAPRHNFRDQRYNAKLHMVNQLQLFMDYPLSYWLTVDLDMASWPGVSANVVSLIHPIFGFFAGYCIFKARHPRESENGGSGSDHHGPGSERVPLVISPAHHNASANGGGSVVTISPTNDVVSGSPAPDSMTPHTRARGLAPSALGTPSIAPGGAGFGDFEMTASSKDLTNAGELGASTTALSPNVTRGLGGSANEEEPGNAVKLAGGKAMFSSANMTLLRWAAFFFWIRNFLDTLDGVIARVQRHRAGVVVTTTSFGFNGHVLDMVTDTAGVTFINVAIFVFLWTKNLALARIPAALLMRFGFRAQLHKSQIVSKAIAFIGLCMVGFLGLCWETTMLRYSNLFDAHANTNPAIFALDNNFHVRLTELLWALTCGDMVLVYIIAAIWFNRMWECAQAMFFLGYPWMLILSMYCGYVWHTIVLADPTAARIVAQNPDLY